MDITHDSALLNIDGNYSVEHIEKQINSMKWVHSIDLGNGLKTKGRWGNHTQAIWDAFDKVDFKGKKVLDIGCWDGLWSFEAEKRGASEVYATDDVSQRAFCASNNQTESAVAVKPDPTFQLARTVLHSKAKYFPDISVYDLNEKLATTDFDIVIFCGIYYHLRHPLLALSKLRSVLKNGGIIIVEGVVLNNVPGCFAEYYYEQRLVLNDPSCWWVPTIPCLRQWVEGCFFKSIDEANSVSLAPPTAVRRLKDYLKKVAGKTKPNEYSRHVIIAEAISGPDPKYACYDADLTRFNK